MRQKLQGKQMYNFIFVKEKNFNFIKETKLQQGYTARRGVKTLYI